MKALIAALVLLPQLALAESIIVTLTALQGLSKLSLPGEVTFESTNVFCEERGLTPMPWAAPRKQKVVPNVVALNGNSVTLEITTKPTKQDICKYRFADFTLWSADKLGHITIEAAKDKSVLDYADLELTSNQNSLYLAECLKKDSRFPSCVFHKDGVKKGHGSGNGARLYVDLVELQKQKEIGPQIEFRTDP